MTMYISPSDRSNTNDLPYWERALLAGVYLRTITGMGLPVYGDEPHDVVETFLQADVPVTEDLMRVAAEQKYTEWSRKKRKAHESRKTVEVHVNEATLGTIRDALRDATLLIADDTPALRSAQRCYTEVLTLPTTGTGARISVGLLCAIRDVTQQLSQMCIGMVAIRRTGTYTDRFALSNQLYRASVTADTASKSA
jgi:hypothetical protein